MAPLQPPGEGLGCRSVVTYLFGDLNQGVLKRAASSKVLLAFDYDGTLAPLVAEPSRASLRVSTQRLLRRASQLYPCVVISGRARADARSRINGAEVRRVFGNHGAEPAPGADAVKRRVRKWLPTLRARLDGLDGVVIENKRLSVAVHYRRASDKRATRRAILAAARRLPGVRIVGGKLAVNLLVADAADKGEALDWARAQLACDTMLYVGDDETDEDAFELARPGRLLSIRVGRKERSAAAYYIRNQGEIDRLLKMLVALRA